MIDQPSDATLMRALDSSPDVMGGAVVFAQTRVPVETLVDYLKAGDSINEFLSDFPTVSRTQVIAVLGTMKNSLASVVEK